MGTTALHCAGNFHQESPTLEDFIIIRHVGDAATDECLTTGNLL